MPPCEEMYIQITSKLLIKDIDIRTPVQISMSPTDTSGEEEREREFVCV